MKPYEKFFENNWRDYEGEGEEGDYDDIAVGYKFIAPDNPQYESIEIISIHPTTGDVIVDCKFNVEGERPRFDLKSKTHVKYLIDTGHWVRI